jgi:acetolactate synthase-1/2/3 large subunit
MDVLNGTVDEEEAVSPTKYRTKARPQGDPDLVKEAAELLIGAQRPVVIAGGSIWWCQASEELRQFIEMAKIPVFLNGMGRGSIPPDHPLFFSYCRSFALNQADVVLISGAPFDFRLGYGRPPLFHREVKVIQIELDATDIGHNRAVEVGIVGDVKHVLRQLMEEYERKAPLHKESPWVERLRQAEARIQQAEEPFLNSDAVPIHPLRLCKEIRNFLDKEATVIGDGGEIVQFASRVLAAYYPGHWLDPGQLGCLGVGTGFAMAAKLARPDKQVLIVNGDGSFGLNAMEFDTMVRHCIPVVSVIGNDGAWGQMKHPYLARYGRCVGVELAPGTRYDKVVEALGGYGEFVERPEDIRPALERAFASGRPACVNVITDPNVSYGGVSRQRREATPT